MKEGEIEYVYMLHTGIYTVSDPIPFILRRSRCLTNLNTLQNDFEQVNTVTDKIESDQDEGNEQIQDDVSCATAEKYK